MKSTSSGLFKLLNKRSEPSSGQALDSKIAEIDEKWDQYSLPDSNTEFEDSDLELNFDDYLAKKSLQRNLIKNIKIVATEKSKPKKKKKRSKKVFKKKFDLGSSLILKSIPVDSRHRIIQNLDKMN